MPELLLELLSEEIPARMQARAAADLERLVGEALDEASLSFGSIDACVTPRRLTLVADGLPARQPDVREERKGPRADAPEKAIAGFLGSVGLDRDRLEERETGKGVFLFAVTARAGRSAPDALADVLPDALRRLPWPKSMRWGGRSLRWVRPLRGILCLFDGAVVRFALEDIVSGDTTIGHRTLAPRPFAVTGFADYADKLRRARVVLDPAERRRTIAEGAGKLAEAGGLKIVPDDALLDEVAGLVEWPVPLMGRIDAAFMDLPPEVMTATMRAHQKYFALEDASGALAPRFVVVADTEAPDGGAAIAAGNERVLRARLSDARFFWNEDRKRPLESRAPELARIVFHAGLGALNAKAERVEALAASIAKRVPGADEARVRRAARLAKADLVTGMVREFPELQGVMGRYYALADGENAEVADAIAEHYAPRGPRDRCPTAPVSVAAALADKIDTLVGFFAIGEKPTGSRDPFALRRAALGVIRLILENGLRLGLRSVFENACKIYEDSPRQRMPGHLQEMDGIVEDRKSADEVARELMEFLADRLKTHLRDRGIRHDRIAAVFSRTGEDDLSRLVARVRALDEFLAGEDGGNLLTAYRRAANIVRIEEKNDGAAYRGRADRALLRESPERELFEALAASEKEIAERLEAERYVDAMAALGRLRRPVDAFFDGVTVNCGEPDLRRNRLFLLSRIGSALESVADFSRIEG